MATEKELGYEPSLLIELVPVRENGKIVNRAFVQKDRSDNLNGAEIDLPDFDKLAPHFKALNLTGPHFDSMDARDSKEMFHEDGSDSWTYEQRNRTIWAEEVQGLLMKAHPSMSADDKKAKADLLEAVFDTRSWTRVENLPAERIKKGFETLKGMLIAAGRVQDDKPAANEAEPTSEAAA